MALVRLIRKALTRPLSRVYHRIVPDRYRADKYWKNRLDKYGLDLRGVGNCTLSSEENERQYREAERVFLDFCRAEAIELKNARVLDIGCGTGFYAEVLRNQGVRAYTGLDITDALFDQLRARYPDFTFMQGDITRSIPPGPYDLILMIDVTQHIVDAERFSSAMRNVSRALAPQGTLVVTAWLTPEFVQRQPHEVARPMEYYRREFPDYSFSEPRPFRDKYVFAVRKGSGG